MADSGYVFQSSSGAWYYRPPGTQSRVGPFPTQEIAEIAKSGGDVGAAMTGGLKNG